MDSNGVVLVCSSTENVRFKRIGEVPSTTIMINMSTNCLSINHLIKIVNRSPLYITSSSLPTRCLQHKFFDLRASFTISSCINTFNACGWDEGCVALRISIKPRVNLISVLLMKWGKKIFFIYLWLWLSNNFQHRYSLLILINHIHIQEEDC